jgi:hypothetical protein
MANSSGNAEETSIARPDKQSPFREDLERRRKAGLTWVALYQLLDGCRLLLLSDLLVLLLVGGSLQTLPRETTAETYGRRTSAQLLERTDDRKRCSCGRTQILSGSRRRRDRAPRDHLASIALARGRRGKKAGRSISTRSSDRIKPEKQRRTSTEMSVYTHVTSSSTQTLPLSVRDVLYMTRKQHRVNSLSV